MRLRYVCIQIASTNSHVFPETTMSGLQNATVTRGDPWTRGSARQTGVQNRQRVPGSETRYSTIFYTAWVCSSIRAPQACPGSTCSCCRPAPARIRHKNTSAGKPAPARGSPLAHSPTRTKRALSVTQLSALGGLGGCSTPWPWRGMNLHFQTRRRIAPPGWTMQL